jgi:malate dehydrogenase (oxaloacetate-decarboxylating)(NADP+)
LWEAPAVAKAAMKSGVAQKPLQDMEKYIDCLQGRLGKANEVMRFFIHEAQHAPKQIVFPEGEEERILRAAQIVVDEKIAKPILLGSRSLMKEKVKELGLDLEGAVFINPSKSEQYETYVKKFYELRLRKGVTMYDAGRMVKRHNIFGMMMVREGHADGLISGLTQHYPDTVRPALQIIGKDEGVNNIAGLYMLVFKNKTIFIADATVNIDPTAEELAGIALLAAEKLRQFDIEPRIAMLSFSNFGGTKHPLTDKVRKAAELVKGAAPDLIIDGEIMADTAMNPDIAEEFYSFNAIKGDANLLICPDLTSANISYKLLSEIGGAVDIGPILLGIKKPVYLLGPGNTVDDIVHMTAMAVFESQRKSMNYKKYRLSNLKEAVILN